MILRGKKGLTPQIAGLFLSLAIIALAGYFLLLRLYPLAYADLIITNAQAQELPPELVAAVIRVESGFAAEAVSPRNAQGLMQLTPETGVWMARQLGLPLPETVDLLDPETNVYLGTAYLAYLIDLFDGNLELALAAYNGGHGNVSKWLEQGSWDGDIQSIKDIPFGETRRFVEKVISSREIYRRVYGRQLQ